MKILQIHIRQFIENVPAGNIFDAHSVIDYLIENHSDDYLNAHNSNQKTNEFHSRISKLIDSLRDDTQWPIERMSYDSYSRNIHNNYSSNACWIRL